MGCALDLIVAGGGPAGLAAAIAARREGMEVAVLEARRGVLDKACGEGLMPGALRQLRALGVTEPHGCPFIGVRFSDACDAHLHADATFRDGCALGVRRTELSRALQERAAALGVRFIEHVVRGVEQRDHEVRVGPWSAPYLIAADGLRSPIRRRLGLELPPRLPARIGSRRHYRAAPWSSRVVVYLGPGAEAYVTPVAHDHVGVAVLQPAARPFVLFEAALEAFPLLARHLVGAPVASRARGAGPFEQRVKRRVAGRVLLVGDAAGYLDPLTGEGVALGIASARAAVAAVCAAQPERYERSYRELSRRYYQVTRALLEVTRSRSLHHSFLRLAGRAPRLLDALLDYLDHGPDAAKAPATPERALGAPAATAVG
jgi:flavin-dependent dehydrogenase